MNCLWKLCVSLADIADIADLCVSLADMADIADLVNI